MFTVSERRSTTRAGLLRLLADISASDWCRHTEYLTPAALRDGAALAGGLHITELSPDLMRSDTGIAVFSGGERVVVVAPPFGLTSCLAIDGPCTDPLIRLLRGRPLLGVVLLRLGRYAVGVLRGDDLVASKTGSRYVKSRHRAGGSSQRRFERSRERLAREMLDEACGVVAKVFSPYSRNLEYVLMGGERHTLRRFVELCQYMQGLAGKTLSRRLAVGRPGRKALDGIGVEAWRSEVVTLTRQRLPY